MWKTFQLMYTDKKYVDRRPYTGNQNCYRYMYRYKVDDLSKRRNN